MMKKTLIALAAAAVAGGAYAQSAVTISGVVDINYGQVDGSGDAAARASDQQRVGQNGSATTAIIISGSEDIGGGLRGIFRYEINPDFVSGDGFTAEVVGRANGFHFVGLTGGFGEVRLGRLNSAFMQNWTTVVSPFGTNLGSGWGGAGVLNRYGAPTDNMTAPTRFNNAIEYQSPVFSGIQARLMYVPERDKASAAANRARVVDAGLRFAQGPITAMLSWQQTSAKSTAGILATASPIGVGGTGTAAAADAAANFNDVDSTLWMLGGRYTMGALTLMGGYWQDQLEIAGVEVADISGWSLGATYRMGAWTFSGAYTQGEDDSTARFFDDFVAVGGIDAGAERTVLGLGVDYAFSKRTTLYGRFEDRNLDRPAVGAAQNEVRTIAVGIRHTF